ncbi:Trypsin-2 [Mactra antiquata]
MTMFTFCILVLCFSSAFAQLRIVNGTDTHISLAPHQVSLQVAASGCTTAGTGYCHICGGSILNENWVLTAAHCVDGGSTSTMFIGAGFTTGQIRDETYTRYPIAQYIMYPTYNQGAGAFPNDVALIRLGTPINLSNSVHSSIELATTDYGNFHDVTCTISGWGLDSTGVIPNQLQSTTGIIDENCGQWSTNNYREAVHICIHNPSTGSCNGDSGGPMVCNGVLAGVTSWGASGCNTGYPSVYARVSTFNSWITTNMN